MVGHGAVGGVPILSATGRDSLFEIVHSFSTKSTWEKISGTCSPERW